MAVTSVAEPLVAAAFAWPLLAEALALAIALGSLVLLAGISVTARAEHA